MRRVDMGGFIISARQKKLVNQVLESTRLSYGPMTRKFEEGWAKLHQVKYALFCNSGTSALQVALHALREKYDWKNGDEVIVPATTFIATMNIVLQNNMKPVFVDVDPLTFNLDPKLIQQAITPRTRAIIAVHLLGQPADMKSIVAIARFHKLKVIEDSCETVSVSYAGKPVGGWGDVSCFSTYASHLVVTGVGGFACTNDADLATRIKGLYNHGRDGIYHSIDDNAQGTQIMKSRFHFTHNGYSYRGTEMESALGIGHLERFHKELKKRQENASYLSKGLVNLEEAGYLKLPITLPQAEHSFMLYGIVVNPKKVNRDSLIKRLEENGIMTRFMMPLLNQPVVMGMFGKNIRKKYPVSDNLLNNGFLLGIHPELTKADLDYVIDVMHNEVIR